VGSLEFNFSLAMAFHPDIVIDVPSEGETNSSEEDTSHHHDKQAEKKRATA
jgi:hypothetical protein